MNEEKSSNTLVFKVDTLWGIYKFARCFGLSRLSSWYKAWYVIEQRNKQTNRIS